MENRIRKHIEGIFAGAPKTRKARDLQEEMIINVIERYHDHVAGGMSEEDAYRTAVTGIGDVSGLIDSLRQDAGAQGASYAPPAQNYAPPAKGYAPPAQDARKRGLSTGAVVAIVICATILLLTLIGGLIAARITGQLFAGDGFLSNLLGTIREGNASGLITGSFRFEDDEGFDNAYVETGSYAVSTQNITAIEINWVAGRVEVLPAPAGETDIRFTESAGGTVSEKYALRYGVSGEKLTIRFCDSSFWKIIDWGDLFNAAKTPQKKLTLYVPASLLEGNLALAVNSVSNSLEASALALGETTFATVSGALSVSNLSAETLRLESVSGNVAAASCAGEKIVAESVSGTITIDGNFNEYDFGSVSGAIEATLAPAGGGVRAETVSGAIKFIRDGDYGFTADVDTVSGRFSSGSLPVSIQNDRYIYGDGAVKFKLETVSGNITIE